MADYDPILLATDLSDPSLVAIEHGCRLADRLGSRLILAYVIDDKLPPVILAHMAKGRDELLAAHRQHAESALAEWGAQHLAGREVERIVHLASPASAGVVAVARERGAGLIVMGMHGHGYLVHALRGSTTERVLHHAPCPVLVVAHTRGA